MQSLGRPFFLLPLLLSFNLKAQSSKALVLEDADDFFSKGNYLSAIPIYKNELKKYPDDLRIRHQLGVCYLNTRVNRAQATRILEEVSKDDKAGDEIWLELGKAYHLSEKIEEAIACYEKYARMRTRNSEDVEHLLEQCQNALDLMKRPVRVSFLNLGKEINSSEPDYYPFIDKDEMTLLFTSRRRENFGGRKVEVDGYRSSDIYQCSMHNGRWSEARNIGRNVNGNLDEQIVGLRPDGLEMYVYQDHIEKFGDLYLSRRPSLGAEFSKPRICDAAINAEIESSGCMNEEGNMVIFARRNKVSGQSDLYISHLLPNGKWGLAQPLPDVINSPYNEDMPYLSYDGTTLYFASEGHNSMGGYDLFKTRWDQEAMTFSQPENLGYPLNTPDDERSICVTRDHKLGYISAYRPDGIGDLDLYRVKFEEEDPVHVIYTGRFSLGDTSTAPPKKYEIRMTVTNTKTNEEYLFIPHSKTGRYVMALPTGNYRLVTYCKGYVRHKEEFAVSDMGKVNLERHKNFHLRKLRAKQSTP